MKILWDFLIYLSSSSGPNPVGLGPRDLDSGPDLFDLLTLDLLIFDLLLQHLLAFDFLPLPLHPSAPMGLWRRCNFMRSWEAVTYQYLSRSTSTSTLCKADTYQYPLRSQYLPVSFAKPTPTSTHCKAIIYQYLIVRNDAFSIVQGADFNIVRGAVFSIVRDAVFSIVWGDAFSIVRGDAFVEMLHRLLNLRWRCSTDWSEVLGEAWGWWHLCGELEVLRWGLKVVTFWGELNLWLCRIVRMRLCAMSGDRVTWPRHYNCHPSRTQAPTNV